MPLAGRMPQWKKTLAKAYRKTPTPAEQLLWTVLRRKQQRGDRWRRQVPTLGYILDFYLPSRKLCVEVDGAVHDEQKPYDARRDAALKRAGILTFRVTNDDVLRNLGPTLVRINTFGGRVEWPTRNSWRKTYRPTGK